MTWSKDPDKCTTLMVVFLKESGKMIFWWQNQKCKFNSNTMKTVSYLFLVITKGILDMSSINLNLSMEKNYLSILYTSNLKDRLWNQQLNLW